MRGEDPSPEVMEVLAPFPRERTWLLPALREAQEALGHLPEAALAQVAAHLRVPLSEVWGVATGYPELRLAPRGHHHARVCTGVSCALLGGGELLAEAARRHGVAVGDTGADKALTLESADCFFECSMAPMIEVDGAYHGRVTPDDVAHLDRWFRARAHHPAAPRGLARQGVLMVPGDCFGRPSVRFGCRHCESSAHGLHRPGHGGTGAPR
jgi:NADH:ubiquinone oxidoreductase subunit E